MNSTISWCLLTFNRLETVQKSVLKNLENAGYPINEIVWCDNASTDGTREWMLNEISPDVCILNKRNVGADPGYNRCLQLARSEWIVITGCDCIMPKDWLKTFVEYAEVFPQTGIISAYSVPIDQIKERIRGPKIISRDKTIILSLPMGRRFFRRSLLQSIGLMREDLGLYGWGDVLWGERALIVCREKEMLCYSIPEILPESIRHEGPIGEFESEKEYQDWKFAQVENVETLKKKDEYHKAGFPFYMP